MKFIFMDQCVLEKTTIANIIKSENENYEIFSFGGKIKVL